MTDEELIAKTKVAFEEREIEFGEFWRIDRSPGSFTTVWFWRRNDDDHNPSAQFDEKKGKLLWCC